MTSDRTRYRLGLDMGTNSIGWAAIRLDDEGQPCGIVGMGVRIFPDGRNPTDKTSNAVDRRVARGQRRRRDRYLKRRGDLLDALVEYGLMPEDADERKEIANDNKRFDPYGLRAKALDEPLTSFELGRAIFHLDQTTGVQVEPEIGWRQRRRGAEDTLGYKQVARAHDRKRSSDAGRVPSQAAREGQERSGAARQGLVSRPRDVRGRV